MRNNLKNIGIAGVHETRFKYLKDNIKNTNIISKDALISYIINVVKIKYNIKNINKIFIIFSSQNSWITEYYSKFHKSFYANMPLEVNDVNALFLSSQYGNNEIDDYNLVFTSIFLNLIDKVNAKNGKLDDTFIKSHLFLTYDNYDWFTPIYNFEKNTFCEFDDNDNIIPRFLDIPNLNLYSKPLLELELNIKDLIKIKKGIDLSEMKGGYKNKYKHKSNNKYNKTRKNKKTYYNRLIRTRRFHN